MTRPARGSTYRPVTRSAVTSSSHRCASSFLVNVFDFSAPLGSRNLACQRCSCSFPRSLDVCHVQLSYSLRHSQVALLIAQGKHPKVIADRLGHSSVRTVLDVYGHLYEGADEAAAERLDEQIASYSRPKRVPDVVVRIPKTKKAQQ